MRNLGLMASYPGVEPCTPGLEVPDLGTKPPNLSAALSNPGIAACILGFMRKIPGLEPRNPGLVLQTQVLCLNCSVFSARKICLTLVLVIESAELMAL
jgi:hypothetical protein